jgi:hypothetical protein
MMNLKMSRREWLSCGAILRASLLVELAFLLQIGQRLALQKIRVVAHSLGYLFRLRR